MGGRGFGGRGHMGGGGGHMDGGGVGHMGGGGGQWNQEEMGGGQNWDQQNFGADQHQGKHIYAIGGGGGSIAFFPFSVDK